jgi:hypothetical protein
MLEKKTKKKIRTYYKGKANISSYRPEHTLRAPGACNSTNFKTVGT